MNFFFKFLMNPAWTINSKKKNLDQNDHEKLKIFISFFKINYSVLLIVYQQKFKPLF